MRVDLMLLLLLPWDCMWEHPEGVLLKQGIWEDLQGMLDASGSGWEPPKAPDHLRSKKNTTIFSLTKPLDKGAHTALRPDTAARTQPTVCAPHRV